VSNKITINATTDLGALHGLETLLQLMQNNGSFLFSGSRSYGFATTWRMMIDAASIFNRLMLSREILMRWLR
jgi:hexosaminidase